SSDLMLGWVVDLHRAIATRRSAGGHMEAEKVDQWLAGKSDPDPQEAAVQGAGEEVSTGLERTLEDLAARVASSQAKQVALRCNGLDEVPETYRRAVKDITIQLVRNAVVHGIEEPSERAKAHKSQVGTLAVEFAQRSDG